MTDLELALDDLTAVERHALTVAASDVARWRHAGGEQRVAAVWHAFACAAAESSDRAKARWRELEDDALGLPGSEG